MAEPSSEQQQPATSSDIEQLADASSATDIIVKYLATTSKANATFAEETLKAVALVIQHDVELKDVHKKLDRIMLTQQLTDINMRRVAYNSSFAHTHLSLSLKLLGKLNEAGTAIEYPPADWPALTMARIFQERESAFQELAQYMAFYGVAGYDSDAAGSSDACRRQLRDVLGC